MLKKLLISAVFGAAALGTIPAMAAEGPNWNKDEKATIETYNKFNACMQAGIQESAKNAAPAIKEIVEARDKAAADATAKAAKAAGMNDDQIKIISNAMLNADVEALANVIMSAEQDAQIGTCAQSLGIATKDGSTVSDEFKGKVNAVQEKYQKFMSDEMQKLQQAPKP